MCPLAFWAALAAVAFWLIGMETKGRSIEEIDAVLTKPAPLLRGQRLDGRFRGLRSLER